jgi:hypothetical protein
MMRDEFEKKSQEALKSKKKKIRTKLKKKYKLKDTIEFLNTRH